MMHIIHSWITVMSNPIPMHTVCVQVLFDSACLHYTIHVLLFSTALVIIIAAVIMKKKNCKNCKFAF